MTAEDGSLRSPYRAVRTVRAPDDGPWPGVLVRTATGDTRVLVDTAVLSADWSGWDAAPGGHVLAPLDLVRRIDGHDVVLPVLTEPLETFLHRRAGRAPLSTGEALTLAVSVLRGCAELSATPDLTGEWWLDDGGRPVLATDVSPRSARQAGAEALGTVLLEGRAGRAWDAAVRAIAAERLSIRELLEAEDALFDVTSPEPLATMTLSPRGAAGAAPASRDGSPATVADPQRPSWQSLIGHVDGDLADTVSRVTTGLWRRARTRPSRRRTPWIVGGAVAAAILAGGVLWPAAGDEVGDTGTAPVPSATGGEAAAPAEPSSAAPEEHGAEDTHAEPRETPDLAAVGVALLDARVACGGDGACIAGVVADPTRSLAGGAIDLPPADRTVTLLDDFGDVAVLRVDATGASLPSQLAVLIRSDEKWLLRDVHDVAQQP
ncbi:hypothetical protein [Microbacterium yannicii]|uniref:hypothetical protein n=1 Tax=Microbacterium yannicii TaxID=671622 RepID=UPI0002FE3825|nr:hypothetical protein [Microbacterium yannicii]